MTKCHSFLKHKLQADRLSLRCEPAQLLTQGFPACPAPAAWSAGAWADMQQDQGRPCPPQPGLPPARVPPRPLLQLCSTSALEGSCTAHRGVNLCLAHPANEKMQWQLLVPLKPKGRGKLFFLLTSHCCRALVWDTWVLLLHQEAQPHPFFTGVRQHRMLSVSPSEGASWRKKGARIQMTMSLMLSLGERAALKVFGQNA